MPRRPWRDISADVRSDPARAERIAEETRALLDASALARLRESREEKALSNPSNLKDASPRISRVERQNNLYLSTLNEYAREMGGEVRLAVVFPDETVELIDQRTESPSINVS